MYLVCKSCELSVCYSLNQKKKENFFIFLLYFPFFIPLVFLYSAYLCTFFISAYIVRSLLNKGTIILSLGPVMGRQPKVKRMLFIFLSFCFYSNEYKFPCRFVDSLSWCVILYIYECRSVMVNSQIQSFSLLNPPWSYEWFYYTSI